MPDPRYQQFDDDASPSGSPVLTPETTRQVDFIEKEIGYDRSKAILDVGCGAGRHSLELVRRGYHLTGVDLSESQLGLARQAAAAEQLSVEFINRDARALNFYDCFQVALLMCEGAFSLMETDEMDWLILQNVARALRPGGRFIMTVPNAAYMLVQPPSASFDPLTFREAFTLAAPNPQATKDPLQCSRRYYTCPEMRWLLRQSGFQRVAFFAVIDGGFERSTLPTNQHPQFGVISDC